MIRVLEMKLRLFGVRLREISETTSMCPINLRFSAINENGSPPKGDQSTGSEYSKLVSCA
jgi:hypothetical protein